MPAGTRAIAVRPSAEMRVSSAAPADAQLGGGDAGERVRDADAKLARREVGARCVPITGALASMPSERSATDSLPAPSRATARSTCAPSPATVTRPSGAGDGRAVEQHLGERRPVRIRGGERTLCAEPLQRCAPAMAIAGGSSSTAAHRTPAESAAIPAPETGRIARQICGAPWIAAAGTTASLTPLVPASQRDDANASARASSGVRPRPA